MTDILLALGITCLLLGAASWVLLYLWIAGGKGRFNPLGWFMFSSIGIGFACLIAATWMVLLPT